MCKILFSPLFPSQRVILPMHNKRNINFNFYRRNLRLTQAVPVRAFKKTSRPTNGGHLCRRAPTT